MKWCALTAIAVFGGCTGDVHCVDEAACPASLPACVDGVCRAEEDEGRDDGDGDEREGEGDDGAEGEDEDIGFDFALATAACERSAECADQGTDAVNQCRTSILDLQEATRAAVEPACHAWPAVEAVLLSCWTTATCDDINAVCGGYACACPAEQLAGLSAIDACDEVFVQSLQAPRFGPVTEPCAEERECGGGLCYDDDEVPALEARCVPAVVATISRPCAPLQSARTMDGPALWVEALTQTGVCGDGDDRALTLAVRWFDTEGDVAGTLHVSGANAGVSLAVGNGLRNGTADVAVCVPSETRELLLRITEVDGQFSNDACVDVP